MVPSHSSGSRKSPLSVAKRTIPAELLWRAVHLLDSHPYHGAPDVAQEIRDCLDPPQVHRPMPGQTSISDFLVDSSPSQPATLQADD